MTKIEFTSPDAVAGDIEDTTEFAPRFGADGLIPVATTDKATGRLLMLAYMNAEALGKTIETGEAWYWSRSRGEFWRKGATSGNKQSVIEIRTDCDQDAIQLVVEQTGPACHTNRQSCFYRIIATSGGVKLGFAE
jgi:phosphoribosyl-AMP cyclohydrolase